MYPRLFALYASPHQAAAAQVAATPQPLRESAAAAPLQVSAHPTAAAVAARTIVVFY
jgi:hypothetical protein